LSGQSQNGGGERNQPPTEKKLADARRKGDVVRSPDISAAAGYLGLAIALFFAGPSAVAHAGRALIFMLEGADHLAPLALGPGGQLLLSKIMGELALALAPLFALPLALVVVSLVAQRAVVFAPEKLWFKLSRISPISVAKNKFGPTGLFEFAKSLLKLVVFSTAVAIYLAGRREQLLGSVQADAASVAGLIAVFLGEFLWLIFAIALVISAFDYLWQRYDHRRKLMMSRQEIQDESKESEGDPHLKQARRQRGYDIATQRMIADVPRADVVIVNPEHFAVALEWDRNTGAAPMLLAKGRDEVALRIRETATIAGIPIHRDPPTARAIFAVVGLGEEVHPDHYRPVAAAIRYAERVRGLAQRRSPR